MKLHKPIGPPSISSAPEPKAATRAFASLLVITYLWVLLTPFVPAISIAGMKRFNLLTENFVAWALQQPVPSMYNFANEGVLIPESLEEQAVLIPTNHFPTRHYTFELRSGFGPWLPQVLITNSIYQGRIVSARHLITERPGGGTKMELVLKK
ncbi:MAG: hypothetical protein ACJAYS_000090 [Lentimonas sp.]|jgi:hypothetical protein